MSDILKDFLSDPIRLSQYRQALKLLDEAGVERLLEILGRPTALPTDFPNRITVGAFEHAESAGWYNALDYVFRLEEMAETVRTQAARPIASNLDFGAAKILKEKGFDLEALGDEE